jgi:hypothetical protein
VVVDPFGVPLPVDRTNAASTELKTSASTERTETHGGCVDLRTDKDSGFADGQAGFSSPFDCAFSDFTVKTSPGKWEAFVDHPSTNGIEESRKIEDTSSISRVSIE